MALVTETTAQRLWPGENPLGQRVRRGASGPVLEIIGTIRNSPNQALYEDEADLFLPLQPDRQRGLSLLVQSTDGSRALLGTIVWEVRTLDASLWAGGGIPFRQRPATAARRDDNVLARRNNRNVGSTAIPGMPAKPVIDIMAAVHDLEGSRPAINALAETGYVYFPYRPDIMHWFCKPSAAFRTHHLHLVPVNSKRWIECLAFRDAIRSDQTLATEYAELKARLAEEFGFDREAYTEGKAPFITRVLHRTGADTVAPLSNLQSQNS